MRGLEGVDSGFVALDLRRFYQIDLTPKVMRRRSWQWLMAYAISLLDIPRSLTRKESTRGL